MMVAVALPVLVLVVTHHASVGKHRIKGRSQTGPFSHQYYTRSPHLSDLKLLRESESIRTSQVCLYYSSSPGGGEEMAGVPMEGERG